MALAGTRRAAAGIPLQAGAVRTAIPLLAYAWIKYSFAGASYSWGIIYGRLS